MEPLVPSGSYCLFRSVPGGTKEGRKLLVWHAGVIDQETGGQYTLKVYHSEKAVDGDGVVNERVVLKPINPDFSAIVLKPPAEASVRAIAEFVRVL